MFNEINILGGGKIGAGFILKASQKFPDTIFNLITRDKERYNNHELKQRDNVFIYNYEDSDKIKKFIACFYCISVNEQEIIKKEISKNRDITRLSILNYNIEIANQKLEFIRIISPNKIFVVTNPVEIISTYLNNNLDGIEIYGLGLELDSKRTQNVLSLFFNLNIDGYLNMLGNHSLMPVPLLSDTVIFTDLLGITFSDIFLNLKLCKKYKFGKTKIDFYDCFKNFIDTRYMDLGLNEPVSDKIMYEIIVFLTNLLIKSEFDENKPPVDNPITSLVDTLHKLKVVGSFINLSYISDAGLYTGGKLKILDNGKFKKIDVNISDFEKNLISKSDLKLYADALNIIMK